MEFVKSNHYFLVKTINVDTDKCNEYKFASIDVVKKFFKREMIDDINGEGHIAQYSEAVNSVQEIIDYELNWNIN